MACGGHRRLFKDKECSDMRLYHVSLIRVETPRIMPHELYRPLDFGSGFYATTDFEQASRWVKIRLGRNRDVNVGYVTAYDFDESLMVSAGLSVKRFDGVSPEWLKFIAANRLNGNVEHGYDIVTGPVANDRVYTVLNLYEGGYIDELSAITRMKAYRLADQFLFHTERSLSGLKYLMTVEVQR